MRSFTAFVLFLGCCVPAAAQTQPSDGEQERRAELVRVEAAAAELPVIHADSIAQVAKLSVEYEMLEAHTSLKPADRECRVVVPNIKGVLRLTVFGPRPPELGGSFFDLLHQDLTAPATGQVYTRISSYADRVNVTRDSEVDDCLTSVQLIQDPPPQPNMPMTEAPVRLYVQRTYTTNTSPPLQFKLAANSFTLLRLTHNRELDQFLRPILRDLQQERALFCVTDALAWIALADSYVPDEQIVTRVNALLPRIDADEFQQRQKAIQELRDLGEPGLLIVARLDKSKLSAQQQNEITAIIEESVPVPMGRMRELSKDPSFLLDLLYSENVQVRKLAIESLGKLLSRSIRLDESLNGKDREAAIARLRDEVLLPSTQPSQ